MSEPHIAFTNKDNHSLIKELVVASVDVSSENIPLCTYSLQTPAQTCEHKLMPHPRPHPHPPTQKVLPLPAPPMLEYVCLRQEKGGPCIHTQAHRCTHTSTSTTTYPEGVALASAAHAGVRVLEAGKGALVQRSSVFLRDGATQGHACGADV